MQIVIMILLLSFLILVHEAGHFMAARMLGIKVDKFGFGLPIGPTLWSGKIGDVEILVHACLLGGYVAFPDDDKDSKLPADSKDRFVNRPVWQRMIVISAGVIANVITAILLVMFTAAVWGKLPSGNYQVYINSITAPKSESVWQSGLKKGDRIVKINGTDIKSTYAISLYSQNSARHDGKINKDFALKNLEILKELNPNIDTEKNIDKDTVIKLPSQEVIEPAIVIGEEELKGYAPYHNDEIQLTESQIKIKNHIKEHKAYTSDGSETLNDVAYAISDGLKPVEIAVLRKGKEISLKPVYPNEKGIIGISMAAKQDLAVTKTPGKIFTESCKYIGEQTYMLVYGLWQLFSGKIPAKDLHGIVVIAKIGGDVIKNSGMFSGLLLTAMISMDLALINFLPIPALDGGHFMFLLIEKLRGKPLNQENIEKISNFFFLLLILLMILIIFNDVYALLKHKF